MPKHESRHQSRLRLREHWKVISTPRDSPCFQRTAQRSAARGTCRTALESRRQRLCQYLIEPSCFSKGGTQGKVRTFNLMHCNNDFAGAIFSLLRRPKAVGMRCVAAHRLRRSPMFIVTSEKQCELRRSGIKVRNQMPLLRSSSSFIFVTINIGLLRSQKKAKLKYEGRTPSYLPMLRQRSKHEDHYDTSFLDHSSRYNSSVELRGLAAESRHCMVASVQRTKFLGPRRRQAARSVWP